MAPAEGPEKCEPHRPTGRGYSCNNAQAGAQLTITGSISIFEETNALEAVTGTVNETGLVTFPPDSLVNTVPMGDDICGTITPAPTMLTFAGNTARFLQTASSDGCGNVEVLGTLTRQ